VQLGFIPLLEAGLIEDYNLIADAKSGVSGAGRKAEVGILFAEAGIISRHTALPAPSFAEIRQGCRLWLSVK